MPRDNNEFFLGKAYDLNEGAMREERVYYDPDDLTTHAVITGMTGSGKTGLGVIILEEAALQGIPAIIVDPKGDLTNLLLHFPDLLPEDFQPWVDKDAARRDGVSVEEAAEKAAGSWKKGLASFGLGKEDLETLRDSAEFAVYTPGSDAGLPVSILASLSVPDIPWEGNREILRERISSTVTALLGLIGMRNIDPVQSKEHILLSNIFEEAWKSGRDLDLATLITHVQSPPFDKLGVFSLDQFYPEKDRFSLAMQLNNFLAAPSFHTWLEGQPLDVKQLLWSQAGKPRHSIFYLAHLNDQERMFFVTLLYTAIESWMRTQKGSSGLRALVYFDEIVGYLPPTMNPPSKNIILRMLKQARAFGVGLILATQNPIDLDYKALSNAGTWMIGKLQTDQDKQRLLDGLEGLTSGLDRAYFDSTISALGKRVFLLHNIHAKGPVVFTTRWAMNYLAGPITRNKLADLNNLVGAGMMTNVSNASGMTTSSSASDAGLEKTRGDEKNPGMTTQPSLSSSVQVYFMDTNRSLAEALDEVRDQLPDAPSSPSYLYKPALLGQAKVYYADRTYNIDQEDTITARIEKLERRGLVRWEEYLSEPVSMDDIRSTPLPNASFAGLEYPVDDEATVNSLSKDFVEWIYRSRALKLQFNEALKLTGKPNESPADFRQRCTNEIQKQLDVESAKIKAKYAKQRESLELKIKRETMELEQDKKDLNQRRLEEAGKGLENVMKLLGSRKASLSTSLSKRRMTSTAKGDVKESEEMIAIYEKQLAEMDGLVTQELEAAKTRLGESVGTIREVTIAPLKKNILTDLFGVVWLPYYAFKVKDEWVTVKAYK